MATEITMTTATYSMTKRVVLDVEGRLDVHNNVNECIKRMMALPELERVEASIGVDADNAWTVRPICD